MKETIKMDRIEDAIADFKEGKFVIVVDDEDRENEGDLIIAAEKITPEKVNFMLKHARGVLCAPVTVSRCRYMRKKKEYFAVPDIQKLRLIWLVWQDFTPQVP